MKNTRHQMMPNMKRLQRMLCTSLASLALIGCATPAFKDVGAAASIFASDVQQSPEHYLGAEVVWGGRIVNVHNGAETTEVEVVGYPLDRDQQPLPEASTVGRFIVMLPGFVEPLDYPPGRHLSVHGRVAGARHVSVDEHDYLYPLLSAREVMVWPWGFMFDKKPRVTIGVGVRIH